jgi:hypothetical protein
MSFKIYKENNYMHDLDLLSSLHKLSLSYPTRSKCIAKSGCLRGYLHFAPTLPLTRRPYSMAKPGRHVGPLSCDTWPFKTRRLHDNYQMSIT